MEEEFFDNSLVKRFEEMIENGEEYYFSSEELEDIVIYYLELGDIDFAELTISYALKLHPNSLEIKVKKLEVLLELEDYTQAKRLITELKSSSMETTDFLVCCAKYYSNLGNPRRAIEYCQKALELNDEENFLHNFIADEFVNLDDPFNALKHYKLALEFDPEDDYALENIMLCYNQLNVKEEAIVFLKNYLDDFPFSETAWIEYGRYFFNKKKYNEAIKGFDYVLAINPHSMGVYNSKAACYEALKNWEKAIEVYEELLEQEYTKSYTYYKIGLCYKAMKQHVLAINAMQNSLREDPQFYMAMMELSDIYYDIGKKQEAIYFAREAVSFNEDNADYQKKLAYLCVEEELFEESIACLKKIVEIQPNSFYNWYVYSEILILVDRYKDAISVIKKSLELFYRAELFYQLSNCYFNIKEEEEAKEYLKIALDLNPSLYNDMKQKYPSIRGKKTKIKKKK